MTNVENALPVQHFAGGNGAGGYWNDGSLMLTPGVGCHGTGSSANCMTNARFTSMFSLWTILSFNILLVGDFDRLSNFVMATYSNPIAIGINQDALGKAAVRIDGGTEGPGALLSTPEEQRSLYTPVKVQECGGEPADQRWVMDYMDGRIHNVATNTCLNVKSCGTELIYDSCPTSGKGCKATPTMPFPNEVFTLRQNGQLVSALPDHLCATVSGSGTSKTVALQTCTSPVSTAQRWKYDNKTQQLTTAGGLCVTAGGGGGPSPVKATTLIVGRPLHNQGFAVLFLNNKNTSMVMTCDQSCMGKMGFPANGGAKYTVEDVITHQIVISSLSAGQTLTTKAPVLGNGASAYYLLTPQN